MISTKDLFRKILKEALTDYQKYQVDDWDADRPEHVNTEIKRVFGDKERIRIPLESGHLHDPDVVEHLERHGFKVKDYANNKAEDASGREIKIGKALTKTKASKDLVDAYSTSAEEARNSQGNLEIVISHHPHDVAGMTSHGQSWEHQSCVNFESGCNRSYLKAEVKNGTHVAYLVNKGDGIKYDNDHYDISAPHARIAIKPFESEHEDTGEQHAIFRADRRTYGVRSGTFEHSVNKWLEEKYPAKEGHEYGLIDGSYDDAATPTGFTGKTLNQLKTHVRDGEYNELTDIPSKHLDEILNHAKNFSPDPEKAISNIIRYNHGSMSAKQINDHIHMVDKESIKKLPLDAVKKVTGKNVQAIADSLGHDVVKESAFLSHPRLPQEIADSIDPSAISELHHSRVTPAHIDSVVDNYVNGKTASYYHLGDALKEHPNKFSEKHVAKLLSSNKENIPTTVFGVKGFTQNMSDRILESGDTSSHLRKDVLTYTPHKVSNPLIAIKHQENPAAAFDKLVGDHENDAAIDTVRDGDDMSKLDKRKVDDSHIDGLLNHVLDNTTGSRFNMRNIAVDPKHLSESTIERLTNRRVNDGARSMPSNHEISLAMLKHHVDQTIAAVHARDEHEDSYDSDFDEKQHSEWEGLRDAHEKNTSEHLDRMVDMMEDHHNNFHNENDDDHYKHGYHRVEQSEDLLSKVEGHLSRSDWNDHSFEDISNMHNDFKRAVNNHDNNW